MTFESVAIIGGGESGVGAAILAKSKGKEVFLSEYGKLTDRYKAELEAHNVPYEEGGHSIEKLKEFELVVKSPGVADQTKVIKGLNDYKVPIISEIEFGFYYTEVGIIGITGSNGKTTTTGLIYHLLKEAGVHAQVGGNIGKSFARLVYEDEPCEVYVLELSSFQLDGIKDFRPDIAVLLNITPDHLDRYDYDFENYVKSKWRIAMNQTSEDLLVYNADLALRNNEPRSIAIGEEEIKNNQLSTESGKIFDTTNTTLKGKHNRFNALCAIQVVERFGLSDADIQKGLETFVNEAHRLQVVAIKNGVTYINDSKATNVDAVFYALDAMEGNVVWIVGGTDKGNDYEPILKLVNDKVVKKIYLGIDNTKLKEVFGEGSEVESMKEAVKAASKSAKKGDVVLLSPACASFDLFKNYIDRGEQFIAAVKSLGEE
ncbi:UDP-N-acetylmuramoyl-L-alanine--D-glutamate ligase [Portibacter lacus]|uniref:UDP-N-acetylmuramoylalanine--D-glutamate ligase n=1 Tax=Portibacter lacus TaxID=1099794 RepID=A0AA37SLB7_9BACT|nr:UDP-N-acetylmuramoyl-L-alanine--D-glutamate ligase [Portibacter lacus]GLR15769.1 UDP-N-acetylmuramoylalanine--D-glutamate ligase [Portibacter lacus]